MRASTPLRWIASTALWLSSAAGAAESLWGADGFAGFCNGLPPTRPAALASQLRAYLPAVEREGISAKKLRSVGFEDMDRLLQRAMASHLGGLELFTGPEFGAQSQCALFLNRDTLAQINRKYDLHALWQIAATRADGSQESVHMSFMIVGQGRIVIGYPQKAEIEITDDGSLAGRYVYLPYMAADIDSRPTHRGFFGLRGLNAPDGDYEALTGPHGVEIKTLKLDGDGILVKYQFGLEMEKRTRIDAISHRQQAG